MTPPPRLIRTLAFLGGFHLAVLSSAMADPPDPLKGLTSHILVMNYTVEHYSITVELDYRKIGDFSAAEYHGGAVISSANSLTDGDHVVHVVMAPATTADHQEIEGTLEMHDTVNTLFKTESNAWEEADLRVHVDKGATVSVEMIDHEWADKEHKKLLNEMTATFDPRKPEWDERKESNWSSDGKPLHTSVEKEGRVVESKDYKPDGSIGAEVKDGKGFQRTYFAEGKLHSETPIKQGRREGLQKTFDADGALRAERQFAGGAPDGDFKKYDAHGKLRMTGTSKQGEMDGPWIRYDADGKESARSIFKAGKQVEGKDEFIDVDWE